MERQITGFGGLVLAYVTGSKVSSRGDKFGGLSVWIVVDDGVVIVIGSIVLVVGGRGRSELSVIGLTFGPLVLHVLDVLCWRLVEVVGESLMGLVVRRGVRASVSAAAASALGGACPSSSSCGGPVDCIQQAFIAVQPSRWKVSFLGVLGGRLVGVVGGRGLASSALAASRGRKGLPGV